tara:strand:+ start:331 stop:555 length:225 start_codon:yes stop_codon:yes gene_type:complete
MTFKSTEHSWAFLPESEYDPSEITLSHYEVNLVVVSDSDVSYRNLEWTGKLLPELATWSVFQNAKDAANFLEQN